MIDTKIIKKNSYIKNILGEIPEIAAKISTDSRNLQGAQIFIGLKGPTFNGANYCENALKQNVLIFVYEAEPSIDIEIQALHRKFPDRCIIPTSNVLGFIQELAHTHLKFWKSKTGGISIGITGSNGKTTNKEMLAHFLEEVFPGGVGFTKGNLNNHIGVPLTLLAIRETDRVIIVELGTNHPGEIKALCKIAEPDHGLITNIGQAHLEFFQNESEVFKEKSELFNYIKAHIKNFQFVIDGDDPELKKLNDEENIISFGEKSKKYQIKYLKNSIQVRHGEEKIVLKNEFIFGKHNFRNLMGTFLLALALWPQKKAELIAKAESFKPKINRSSWVTKKNIKIFLDAYNANPSSMLASIDAFVEYTRELNVFPDSCGFIIGDMNELGELSAVKHRHIGACLKDYAAKNVNFVGHFTKDFSAGFGADARVFSKASDLKDIFTYNKEVKYLFIKGSRSLQLESILDIV